MNERLTADPGLIPVCLEGKRFTFRADSDFAACVARLAEEAMEQAENDNSGDRDYPEVAAFLCYVIDSLIGDGTIEELYGEETPDLFTLLTLLDAIIEAFDGYRKRRLTALNRKETAI